MSAANELKVRRVLEFVRALTNYIDDVIGHGPNKLDYFKLLERDLGPLSMPLVWRLLDLEKRHKGLEYLKSKTRRRGQQEKSEGE
jgi:hypothetical protein